MSAVCNDNDIMNTGVINPAPVVIFVYRRADHAENLLKSLGECPLAKQTDVYIYSDGAHEIDDNAKEPVTDEVIRRIEREKEDVNAVRLLVKEERWKTMFKSLTIREAARNKGLANSVIAGVTEVVNTVGRAIVLEDDLVVAKDYLQYMNSALERFENDGRIFSVAGWSYPLKGLKHYEKDAWIHYRACSWGWATWSDRWNAIVWDPKEARFEHKLADDNWRKEFERGGNDLPGMLRLQLDGKRDSWAIRWNAASSEANLMTVYPRVTRIVNDGRDGSGTHSHSGQSDYDAQNRSNMEALNNQADIGEYDFDNITVNTALIKEAWRFDSDTLGKKIRRNLRTIFVEHKVPNVFKKIFGK